MKQISRRRFLGSPPWRGRRTMAACQPQAAQQPAAAPTAAEAGEPAATVAAAPAEAEVTLRLAEGSWVGPEGIAYWTDNIIPKFESENPGIKVTFESAESSDYADKLYTQAVAGDAPDVFFIWWSAGLMEQGQLLQLDEYFSEEYLADFYPGNVVGQVYNGHCTVSRSTSPPSRWLTTRTCSMRRASSTRTRLDLERLPGRIPKMHQAR